jgi:hypothetical protein
MAIESIVAQIDSEITKLVRVRALLSNSGKVSARLTALKARTAPAKPKARKKRVLSPEARKRIADAQRRRWAAQKARAKGK